MLNKEEFYKQLKELVNPNNDELRELIDKIENRYMAGYLHNGLGHNEEFAYEYLLETETYSEWKNK